MPAHAQHPMRSIPCAACLHRGGQARPGRARCSAPPTGQRSSSGLPSSHPAAAAAASEHPPGSLVRGPSSPMRCRICTDRKVNSQSSMNSHSWARPISFASGMSRMRTCRGGGARGTEVTHTSGAAQGHAGMAGQHQRSAGAGHGAAGCAAHQDGIHDGLLVLKPAILAQHVGQEVHEAAVLLRYTRRRTVCGRGRVVVRSRPMPHKAHAGLTPPLPLTLPSDPRRATPHQHPQRTCGNLRHSALIASTTTTLNSSAISLMNPPICLSRRSMDDSLPVLSSVVMACGGAQGRG